MTYGVGTMDKELEAIETTMEEIKLQCLTCDTHLTKIVFIQLVVIFLMVTFSQKGMLTETALAFSAGVWATMCIVYNRRYKKSLLKAYSTCRKLKIDMERNPNEKQSNRG